MTWDTILSEKVQSKMIKYPATPPKKLTKYKCIIFWKQPLQKKAHFLHKYFWVCVYDCNVANNILSYKILPSSWDCNTNGNALTSCKYIKVKCTNNAITA